MEADSRLIECRVYVDLNMVRVGVVAHPSDWSFCGYTEIQNPRQRYSLIDYEGLMGLFGIKKRDELKKVYGVWLEEAIKRQGRERQPRCGFPVELQTK